MPTAPASPSPATAWVLGVTGVILFYFLSVPVVAYAVHRYYFRYGASGTYPELAERYEAPYVWLEMHTPMGLLLGPYARWWLDRVMVP